MSDFTEEVTYATCTVCGVVITPFACSDCKIDTGVSVHVCSSSSCQRAHERTHKVDHSSTLASEPQRPINANHASLNEDGSITCRIAESERVFTPRGFEDFCEFTDASGHRVVVRESSVFPPTCVHLFCTSGAEGPGRAYEQPYLTKEQALKLAQGLLRFAQREEG
jgi:hypothetical protein